MGVQDALGLNLDQRPHLAKAMAAALFQIDSVPLGFGNVLHHDQVHSKMSPELAIELLEDLRKEDAANG